MSNSYLLRDSAGKAAGYILVGKDEICCKILESERQSVLRVYSERGMQAFVLQASCAEQSFPFYPGLIASAQIEAGGHVILATDWALIHQETDAIQVKDCTRTGEETYAEHTTEKTSTADHKQNHQREEVIVNRGHIWPERRWPPPACCPQAVYVHGVWQTES